MLSPVGCDLLDGHETKAQAAAGVTGAGGCDRLDGHGGMNDTGLELSAQEVSSGLDGSDTNCDVIQSTQ